MSVCLYLSHQISTETVTSDQGWKDGRMVKLRSGQTGGTVPRWKDRHVFFLEVIKSQVVSGEGEGLGAVIVSGNWNVLEVIYDGRV